MKRRNRRLMVALLAGWLGGCGSVVSLQSNGDAAGEVDGEEATDVVSPEDSGAEDARGEDGGVLTCGNGIREDDEECDDGNPTPGDGCEPDCRWTCDAREDCDDGNACNGEDTCTDHRCIAGAPPPDGTPCVTPDGGAGLCRGGLCASTECGNGSVDPGEECDDANDDNTDACLADCRDAFCGDGFVRTGVEDCEGDIAGTCRTACGSEGTVPCVSCRHGACQLPPETCNGADDDCDGTCDDGFACCLGLAVTGSDGTCAYRQDCATGCAVGPRVYTDPAPGNDRCAGATPLAAGPGTARYADSTCGASADYPPPAICGVSALTGPDVVFWLTLDEVRLVRLTATGSGFVPLLWIAQATEGSCPGAPLACTGASDPSGSATIETTLGPGDYAIVLAGAGGGRGAFTLDVTISGAVAPVNDACSAAIDLSPGTSLGATTGTTAGATSDNPGCDAGLLTPGPDVWYRFTVGATRHVYYFDVVDGGSWNSVLRIREGSCTGREVTCADDACGGVRSQFVGLLGSTMGTTTYYLAVDGATATDSGTFTLRYQMAGPACATARLLTGDGSYSGTLGAARGITAGSCGGGGPEDLYYFGLCPSRTVTMETCNVATLIDTVLYVRSGGCGGTTTEIACSDDASGCGSGSWIDLAGEPQGLYFLLVDSYGSVGGGAYRLDVSGM